MLGGFPDVGSDPIPFNERDDGAIGNLDRAPFIGDGFPLRGDFGMSVSGHGRKMQFKGSW
jgi:hypothetical protein